MTDMDGLVYEVARRWTEAVHRGVEIETLDDELIAVLNLLALAHGFDVGAAEDWRAGITEAMRSAPWQ